MRATRLCSGHTAANISCAKAIFPSGAVEKRVQKASIKRIAHARCVDQRERECGLPVDLAFRHQQ